MRLFSPFVSMQHQFLGSTVPAASPLVFSFLPDIYPRENLPPSCGGLMSADAVKSTVAEYPSKLYLLNHPHAFYRFGGVGGGWFLFVFSFSNIGLF